MRSLPRVGDILWCRFPERPRDLPGPKSRPVLVLSVSIKDHAVKCAYGTSQHLDHLYVGEFAIRRNCLDMRAFMQSGLKVDTKFSLINTLDLPWNELFFVPPCPKNEDLHIGSLHESLIQSIRAAYQAAHGR